MFSKALVALAAASFVAQAVAVGHHRNDHQHIHQRGATVTTVVTETAWVYVTVSIAESETRVFMTNSHKSKPTTLLTSSSKALPTIILSNTQRSSQSYPPLPSLPPMSFTPVTQVAKQVNTAADSNTQPPAINSQPPVVNSSPPPPPPPPASTSNVAPPKSTAQSVTTPTTEGTGGKTGSSGKRGLAYNNPGLITRFLSSGSKVSWAYNWGQFSEFENKGINLEFCPMLWGLKLDFADTWPKNAQKAIDAGSKCLMSFNEPDIGSQSNISPQQAAQKHRELMNPFAGKAKIGSPAISNSPEQGQGIDWLKQWFSACGGNCAVDFVNIHIYGVDTNVFLAHLLNVHNAFNKPVWITEFAFGGSDEQINSQLATVIDQIENNSTYSFVERYSYFMAADGVMAKGNSMSVYGNTFAYGG